MRGHWDEPAYWNPLPTVRRFTDTMGTGRWEDRSRLNVPGPFLAGETDDGQNEKKALQRYASFLDNGLEQYLRGCLFWLDRGPRASPRRTAADPLSRPRDRVGFRS
ncbi:hypothetical protein [Streptomyces sp. H27-C3]|uniref:hypothetical protein n=1 Tax=Streptomyces sp. H27-C3 TaxID=3046305 RepID=UPI0024BBC577|nr:hypothetical protein [Streptomyces sp. H27-C3]MDJ0463999.1 hypothetical protein [Streptomyces sp. H27-C3]